MSQPQRFRPQHEGPFPRPSGAVHAVTVSERLALSLRALGAAGDAWLAGLPGLLASLAAGWPVIVGARLDGGHAAYVAEAVALDGTPVVIKAAIPPGIDGFTPLERELAALQLAGGDPYAGLLRYDVPRRSLLPERLGQPMASLGWPASRQVDALARTAARGWRPVPDDGRLITGAEAARWLAGFISSTWEDLARPCPEAAVDLAARCAAAREAAFDPGRAVLVHGDVHAFNALQAPGPAGAGAGFRLVDPGGLISEPAHDLGVIQVRGVQGWIGDLAARDPREASRIVARRCERAGRLAGADPEAVWQWAFAELVSTGLFMLRLGHHQVAEAFLAVAGKLTAAIPDGQRGQARQADPVTAERGPGERLPAWRPLRPPPAPGDVRPGPAVTRAQRVATLFLMVGLPGAGKTTRAKELAAAHQALRLTPDEWMIPLFGEPEAGGKRDVLEGRLISVAIQTLRLGTSVVLDFGLWGRDERSALRWLARSAGAACQVVYLPVDRDAQLARIADRQASAPHQTFPMTEADVDRWRDQFQVPDAAELDPGEVPGPPAGWRGWQEWAADRWPSLADG
jgi:streptomycin 6-kinase